MGLFANTTDCLHWHGTGTVSYCLAIVTAPQPPVVNISFLGNQACLAWPTNAAGFVLETSTNLAPPAVWVAVTNPPTPADSQMVLWLPMDARNRFFRLRQP